MNYLKPRGKRGIYQLRVPVPRPIQAKYGKRERIKSLGTSDRATAVRDALPILAEWQAEFRALVAGDSIGSKAPAADNADPTTVAVHVAFDDMLRAMEERRKEWPADDAGYAARLAEREADLRRFTRKLRDGDTAQWEATADRIIAKRGLTITKGSAEYGAFVQTIAEVSIDAIGMFTRQAAGELDAAPRTAVVREVKAKESAKAAPGESLIEQFELWGAEKLAKGSKRPDTVNQDRKVIKQFAAFVGTDRSVESITPLEVAEYRDTMRKLPPKWMSNKQLRGLDMRSAAAKARELNLAQTAFTNVNKHLSTVSPLYKWMARHPRWAGLRNPTDGLFYDDVKGKNPRPPFTTAHLNTIVNSPLFTGFEGDGREHVEGTKRTDDWRYWIPLICLFTGARLGEIAQLRVGDVRKECGVWFIHIRHEEKQGLTTKSGKSRAAVVHPMLERIGFLAFRSRQVERAGDDATAPMFPELTPNSRGQISGTPSDWWRDYLSAIGVKNGRDGFGTHSFRHTMTDRLRSEAELLDDQIEVCLGHNQKTTTSGYGELPQGTVTMFKSWMDSVTFKGVNFDHLIPA